MTATVDRSVGCELHRSHSPEPTYLEVHHVVPQAWQLTWRPETPPSPGPSAGGVRADLWDARTVVVCRTGHGNIHHWIVRLMELARDHGTVDVDALIHLVLDETRAVGHHPGRSDLEWAAQALLRFQKVGGDLATLIAARQYGVI